MSVPLITFIIASLGFAAGTAGGATWMDSGELAAAAWQLGVAHPPGHPAFVLLGKLASLVPIGEIGFRIALVSAVGMGAAAAAVVAIAQTLVPRARLAACLSALLLVLSPAVAFNAHRVEVYGPTLALVGWALWMAIAMWRGERARARHVLGAAACLGLAAAIHPVIAATCAVPVVICAVIRAPRIRVLGAAVMIGALGLSTYLMLPARANAESPPELAWGDPATAGATLDVIAGRGYRDNFEWSGIADRIGDSMGMLAEGSGRALLLAGLIGLLFGAVTRLRGAGVLVGLLGITALGAALQSGINPDLRAYLLPGLMACAVGSAIAADAVARIAGAERLGRLAAQAVVVGGVGLFGFCGAPGPDEPALGDPADVVDHFEHTAAAMPPGPGVFFTRGDPGLFAAMYAQLVAGDRPDIAVASINLVRDVWYVKHVKRRVPDLYVPYIDDGRAGQIAERMAVGNMRSGAPVGADVPAFGKLRPPLARPLDRGYALGLTPGDAGPGQQARPPPRYRGHYGRKVAAATGLTRAIYEQRRGRLSGAAVALGLDPQWVEALSRPPLAGRPALFPELPRHTPVLLHAEWLDRLMLADMLWQIGAPPVPIRGPVEQRQLGVWQRLLAGDVDTAVEALGRLDLGTPIDQLSLLGVALGQTIDPSSLAASEALFERAIALDPQNDQSFHLLGVTRARRGNLRGAAEAWRRALELAPGRRDTAVLLRRVESDLSKGALP